MRTKIGGWTALLAVAALAACSDDGTTPDLGDDATLNADVATFAAQVTIDDVDDMWLSSDLVGPLGIPGLGRRGGEHFRAITVTFLDGDGDEMPSYDPLLTATVETVLDVSVTREGPRWEATMDRHREMAITGLEGEEAERTWNGLGTDHVSRMRVDEARSYTMDGDISIDDVVVAVPRAENPWPLSGSITRHVVVTVVSDGGERTVERTVTITFDGTQYATLVVNGETYTVDLADREGHRPERRRGG
ncbi:MAG: hypothetical protein PVI57_05985 [Gemmatimonadota bacterium]